MDPFKNKTALITGASRGIGKATAQVLAGLGCHLILIGRSEETLKDVKKELCDSHSDIHVKTIELDLSKPENISESLADINDEIHF